MNSTIILTLAAKFLNLYNLLDCVELGGTKESTDQDKQEIEYLKSCLTMVINQLATNYNLFKTTKELTSQNGEVAYSQITSNVITQILSVKCNGVSVSYVAEPNKLKTASGALSIEYAYAPNSLTETMPNYRFTSQIYAYGVCAEYCFINGLFDDAEVWDKRFTDGVVSATRPKREVKIKQRLWI